MIKNGFLDEVKLLRENKNMHENYLTINNY